MWFIVQFGNCSSWFIAGSIHVINIPSVWLIVAFVSSTFVSLPSENNCLWLFLFPRCTSASVPSWSGGFFALTFSGKSPKWFSVRGTFYARMPWKQPADANSALRWLTVIGRRDRGQERALDFRRGWTVAATLLRATDRRFAWRKSSCADASTSEMNQVEFTASAPHAIDFLSSKGVMLQRDSLRVRENRTILCDIRKSEWKNARVLRGVNARNSQWP